jgi:hypothetical protein
LSRIVAQAIEHDWCFHGEHTIGQKRGHRRWLDKIGQRDFSVELFGFSGTASDELAITTHNQLSSFGFYLYLVGIEVANVKLDLVLLVAVVVFFNEALVAGCVDVLAKW